jgi:hypothetical protein
MWLVGVFPGAVFKRLRSIDASTLSADYADAEESVEVMNTPSETVRDADESASADSDLIDVGGDEALRPSHLLI